MNNKLAIFTTATDPWERGDTFTQSMACYHDLADNVYLAGKDWPKEFSWEYIGQTFQKGYEMAEGEWVIHADLDFMFHERDFGKIRQALRDYPFSPAISFYKWQFILPDRYNLKSRLAIAVNKKQYSGMIKFDSGGDLCQPSFNGKELSLDEIPQSGVPFYNYEKLTKTREQITDDVERMDRAYMRRFGRTLYSNDEHTAYGGWYKMMSGRFQKPSEKIPLEAHPKYIQETIKNLRPDQFGYNGFGLIEGKVYA